MKYKCNYRITDNYLENLLKERGINNYKDFLNPTEKNLLDFNGLDNILEATDLLINKLREEKNILFIIDCDEDGFTSSAMLYNYILEQFPKANLDYKIHSGKQHGLEDMIEEIENSQQKIDLVLIPDASSNDYEYHKRLKDVGIPVIVLDHHEAEKYSEDAIIVNNQLSESYSNKDLSGAGVVFKFLKALDYKLGVNKADNFIDLAAVGIIGDMMNINNLENRYIISQGLSNIKNPGLIELINKQSFSIKDKDNLTPTDVSFYITPLVNAIIRVGKPAEKELLFKAFINGNEMIPKISRNKVVEGQFESVAEQNARNCSNARARQNRMLDKAIEKITFDILKNGLNENAIIISEIEDDSIDTTLTGLLAMKIVSKFHKPVLLGRKDDYGYLKGSLRGVNNGGLSDLRQFLIDSNLFEYAEGHANAAGYSLLYKNIDKFISYANKQLKDINFDEGIYSADFCIDSTNLDKLNNMIFDLCQDNTIFGKGCEEPLIVVEDIMISPKDFSICGGNKNTIRITKNDITFIMFKADKLIEDLSKNENSSLTIIGTPNINSWMGKESPQILIKDYNISENSIFDF